MQVEAIYHQGQVQFKQPMRFKYDDFPITVTLPEDAVIMEAPVEQANSEAAQSLLERIKSILGEHYRPRPEPSIEQDRETLLEALEERYSR
ncbi:hypothetical protein [Thiothrix eikelboomii]|uniref:hypothetical protein n=1 Tax=Thiothrix eikelboomii TaxID=92487 RepID=UPI003BB2148F